MSSCCGSTPRTPSIVLSRIGNVEASAIAATFIPSPKPISRIITEMSAGAGIERRKSMVGASARRPSGQSPSTRPRRTPTTTAMRNPSTNRVRLGTRSVSILANSQLSRKASTMRRSGGKKGEVLSSLRNHQSAIPTTGSQTSSRIARSRLVTRPTPFAARDASAG
jgi:hypothetical protein